MPLSRGDKLGPYEIVAPIGKGGMGEVWRARDPRLGRDVAIKVSAHQFSDRFEREARAIAALNHPNICQLYDVGPNYLVMELIDGVPLKGPLPVEKAVEYASQILDALDAAHRKGITHRDLKPANILVTKQGIKLLDFGLAKQTTGLGPEDATIQGAITAEGQISGTLQYMSPEQLQGKQADARSDIFSFGCVLYEMLSGSRAFGGTNAASVIAAIMQREPEPLKAAPPLDRVIRKCLAKDPDERFQTARDLKYNLGLAMETVPEASATSGSRPGKTGWIVAGVLAVIVAALAFIYFRQKPPETPVIRSTILPPDKNGFHFDLPPYGTPALSPDGRRLVFGAQPAGGPARLWIRSLDATAAQPIAGTEGVSSAYPFWSPDGSTIGFSADGKLKKIDLSGGPAVTLANAPTFRGASWSPQGVILFAPNNTGGLQRISAAGGATTPATSVDPSRKENSHRRPWFLPDGRHFLYTAIVNGTSDATIYVGALDSREARVLTQASSNAIYASGYLLFLREDTLMAQPFDAKRLATTGEAVPVADQVGASSGAQAFFTAAAGTLVFQTGAQASQSIAWLDRTGSRVATYGEPGLFSRISLVPDGKRAVISVFDRIGRNYVLWIYDLVRNLRSRLTVDPGNELEGVWSPDGSQIVFSSDRRGRRDLYRKPTGGTGAEEFLYADGLVKNSTSWSPDGKFVMYYSQGDPKTGPDILVLPLTGDRKPIPFLKTNFSEQYGQFSPDGHWVAYMSNESGRNEVYVAQFPGAGGKRQVSVAGGTLPRWRTDGKELFYLDLGGRLMASEVNIKGSEAEVGTVRPLFGPLPNGNGYQYAPSADGRHFLAVVPNDQAAAEPLTLIQNWPATLKK
jgi:serine/threonine protein kinase/Tol biopolymer transport system component